MRPLRRWDRWSRAAAAALAASAAVAAVSAATAWRVELPEPGRRTSGATLGVPEPPAPGRAAPDSLLRTAVSAGPFRPDRSAPGARYHLPSEREPERDRADADMRLVGTAILPGRPGLAAFRLSAGGARVVRQGDRLEGYRVAAVAPGTARLVGPDTTVVLEVKDPGDRGGRP